MKVEEEVRVRKCAEEVTGVTLEVIVGGCSREVLCVVAVLSCRRDSLHVEGNGIVECRQAGAGAHVKLARAVTIAG